MKSKPNQETADDSAFTAAPCSDFAQVGIYCGRHYLKIGNQVIAMEGDICRNPHIADRNWTEHSLRETAKRINQ